MPAAWKPDSWRSKPIVQVPEYPDPAALAEVDRNLANFPPLVFVKEVRDLKERLADVAAGKLDPLANEALAEHRSGRSRQL